MKRKGVGELTSVNESVARQRVGRHLRVGRDVRVGIRVLVELDVGLGRHVGWRAAWVSDLRVSGEDLHQREEKRRTNVLL